MNQLYLAMIEDFLMSFFICRYSEVRKNDLFIFILSILCICETMYSNNSGNTFTLPPLLTLTIVLCISIFKGNICLNDFLAAIIAPILILVTDLISLILFSTTMCEDLIYITKNYTTMFFASLVAKGLFSIACYILIKFKPKETFDLNFCKWWILLPIWIILYLLLYILGLSITGNNVSIRTIHNITFLLVLLSIFILILFHKIEKENLMMMQKELEIQKNFYIRKNLLIINKLHNEIMKIEHETTYKLLYTKMLIVNKDYYKAKKFIEENIHSIKKFKNLINTPNTMFNYLINSKINELLLFNTNMKITCNIDDKNFSISENKIKMLVTIIDSLFNISNKQKQFSITIRKKSFFLKVEIIMQKKEFYSDDETILIYYFKQKLLNYQIYTIEEYRKYVVIVKLDGNILL